MNPLILASFNLRRIRAVNQLLILQLLNDRPHAVARLVEDTHDTRQAVHVALKQLEARKLIRLSDQRLPGVPRSLRVASITDTGRQLVAECMNPKTP